MTESEEESFSFFNFFRPLEVLSADHPDICEKDEGALAFLKDIEWSMVDTESFKIDFFFEKSNPFFSNPVLTKTYYYMLRHEILLGTEGSLIELYPGKSLTENTTRKKVIDKRVAVLSAKNKEPMTETKEESFSFFNFFSPLEVLMADHQVRIQSFFFFFENKNTIF
nr:nucleosome assembly protein 1 [Ipomoea batatas]